MAMRARPAVLLRRRCQQTATRSARLPQPTVRRSAAAEAVSAGSAGSARGREGGAGTLRKAKKDQGEIIAARSLRSRCQHSTARSIFPPAFMKESAPEPSETGDLWRRGRAHREAGRWEKAAVCFRKIVEVDHADGEAMAAWGQALRGAKRKREAVAVLRQACGLRPGDAELRCELGDAWLDLGHPREAVPVYAEAARLDPTLARAFYGEGCAHMAGGEFAEAVRCQQGGAARCAVMERGAAQPRQRAFQAGAGRRSPRRFRRSGARPAAPSYRSRR